MAQERYAKFPLGRQTFDLGKITENSELLNQKLDARTPSYRGTGIVSDVTNRRSGLMRSRVIVAITIY